MRLFGAVSRDIFNGVSAHLETGSRFFIQTENLGIRGFLYSVLLKVVTVIWRTPKDYPWSPLPRARESCNLHPKQFISALHFPNLLLAQVSCGLVGGRRVQSAISHPPPLSRPLSNLRTPYTVLE